MAKSRTLNEIRQTKEYQIARKTVGKYENCTGDVKTDTSTTIKNHFEYAEVDSLVECIADKLQSEIFDLIFQAVNDEMSNYYTFQDTNYFTEAGLELFEDQWFEFYHENHGKIMHKLLQNLK